MGLASKSVAHRGVKAGDDADEFFVAERDDDACAAFGGIALIGKSR